MKVWLIQEIISPYRIKLFEEIARYPDVDFKLILISQGLRCVPQWNFAPGDMPFKAERVPGLSFYTTYENQICINPLLLIKMLKEKPDVVICAGFSFATLLAMIHKLVTKRPYIVWSEGTIYTESGYSVIRTILRRIICYFADAFVVAGSLSRKYIESLLKKMHQKSLYISYNCVDNQCFSSYRSVRLNGKNLRQEFHTRYPQKNILYVGQFIKRKGIIQLLEVYGEVITRYSEKIGLILVGQGPLENYIEKEKKKHNWQYLFIEPYVVHQEVPKYYALADVFMLLSLSDRGPLVVVEALASGLPVICSEHAGNAIDFIDDGKNGYIVDPYDFSDIAKKTINLLDNQDHGETTRLSTQSVQRANYHDSAKAFVDACYLVHKNK